MSRHLDAVPGYRWEEEDVRFERADGWYDGFLWGLLVGVACCGLGVICGLLL